MVFIKWWKIKKMIDFGKNNKYRREAIKMLTYLQTLSDERLHLKLMGLVYFENHHILPKSLGGSNESNNMILLTLDEHGFIHYLYAMFIVGGKDGGKMAKAFNSMFMNRKWKGDVIHYSNRDNVKYKENLLKLPCGYDNSNSTGEFNLIFGKFGSSRDAEKYLYRKFKRRITLNQSHIRRICGVNPLDSHWDKKVGKSFIKILKMCGCCPRGIEKMTYRELGLKFIPNGKGNSTKDLNTGIKHNSFSMYFVVPWGIFPSLKYASLAVDGLISSSTISRWCKRDTQITKQAYDCSGYLQTLHDYTVGCNTSDYRFFTLPKETPESIMYTDIDKCKSIISNINRLKVHKAKSRLF